MYVAGLREDIVVSVEQVMQLLAEGEANRHIGATKMNEGSSRSHTVFRMVSTAAGNVSRLAPEQQQQRRASTAQHAAALVLRASQSSDACCLHFGPRLCCCAGD